MGNLSRINFPQWANLIWILGEGSSAISGWVECYILLHLQYVCRLYAHFHLCLAAQWLLRGFLLAFCVHGAGMFSFICLLFKKTDRCYTQLSEINHMWCILAKLLQFTSSKCNETVSQYKQGRGKYRSQKALCADNMDGDRIKELRTKNEDTEMGLKGPVQWGMGQFVISLFFHSVTLRTLNSESFTS